MRLPLFESRPLPFIDSQRVSNVIICPNKCNSRVYETKIISLDYQLSRFFHTEMYFSRVRSNLKVNEFLINNAKFLI